MATTAEALEALAGVEAATVLEQGTLGTIVTSEIRQQLDAAKRWPRDMDVFVSRVDALVCIDEECAKSMFYSIKRAGKRIEGGSIELAELCWQNFGNVRIGSDIIDIEDKVVIARGMCHDLENNTAIMSIHRRPILDSGGERFSDDMVNVTSNAAMAIARRNAMFSLIPRSTVAYFWRQAKAKAIGTTAELPERRNKMVAYFKELGVSLAEVLIFLKRPEQSQITQGDLGDLITLCRSIQEGTVQVEQVFPKPGEKSGKGTTLTPDKPKRKPRGKKKDKPEEVPAGDEVSGEDAPASIAESRDVAPESSAEGTDASAASKPKAKPVKHSMHVLDKLIKETKTFEEWEALQARLQEGDLYKKGEVFTIEHKLLDQLGKLSDDGDARAKDMFAPYYDLINTPQEGEGSDGEENESDKT